MSGTPGTNAPVNSKQIEDPKLKEAYAAFGAEKYKTPMQKWFEPIRHIGVNYIFNSLVSIALLTEATHGSLRWFYEPIEKWAKGVGSVAGKLGEGIAEYVLGIFTLCIPGHILTPVMSWMANHEAKMLRSMDGMRDRLRGHTPDEVERQMRENVYAALDARPKQTVKDMVKHRAIGMATNLSIQTVGQATLQLSDRFKGWGHSLGKSINPDADLNPNSATYLHGLSEMQKRYIGWANHAPTEFTSCLNTTFGAAMGEKYFTRRQAKAERSANTHRGDPSPKIGYGQRFTAAESHGAAVKSARGEAASYQGI